MSDLRIRGVSKRFGHVTAVGGVDLDVPAGSRTAVVGASGSGKSTLLRLVAGFEAPDAGVIAFGDEVLAKGPRIIPAHKRGIGIVSQDGALFPHLDVAENISFGLDKGADKEASVAALLEAVELEQRLATRRPHELSGGQQQRVALARALARRPRLMLLDEPFSALDASLRQSVREVVAHALQSAGVASILVTHDQAEALSFADQVAVIRDGLFAQVGPPRDLYLRPLTKETAVFLGRAILILAYAGPGYVDCALGRIPAATRGKVGPVEVMLRPEQVMVHASPSLESTSPVGRDGRAVPGVVTDSRFEGADCAVTVSVGDGAMSLALKLPSFGAPEVGTVVHLIVGGEAHVF
ncbi:ABC transporter ATP-binding protein [Alsobacter sp. SYSU BS001988]|jgi:iron(III) transport system ATP-binding protein